MLSRVSSEGLLQRPRLPVHTRRFDGFMKVSLLNSSNPDKLKHQEGSIVKKQDSGSFLS